MDGVGNDYIDKAVDELISALGVKEFLAPQQFVFLLDSHKVRECIKAIGLQLGVPIEPDVSYVAEGYRPGAKGGFQTSRLVTTDRHHRATGSISAQVSIPQDLPLYGSPSLVNFPISVRLSENCSANAMTFIVVMAHELSHVLLHSLWHREKDNEFYTDLTAMILGFADIMRTGRKVVKNSASTEYRQHSTRTTTYTNTTTYGYLSDANFTFAFEKIERVLNKHRFERNKLLGSVGQFKKKLDDASSLPWYFLTYLQYLDSHLRRNIPAKDGHRISAFHQFGYIDVFRNTIKKSAATLGTTSQFAQNLRNYTAENVETIRECEAQLDAADRELTTQHCLLREDVKLLRKYVSPFHRLKLRFTPAGARKA